MMGFQDACIGSCKGGFFHYQRLQCQEDGATVRPRWQRSRTLNGMPSFPSFFHVRKLKWRRIASVLLPRWAIEFSSKICHTSTMDIDICPTIVFSSQWGLPVLSHPSRGCKKIKYYPYGKGF